MSPYVLFEIGRARVGPFVERPLTSFVHDFLGRRGQLKDYTDNRPRAVRGVHTLVTLLAKLDALSRRYARESIEPDGFARHYENAAHIIRSLDRLPATEQSPRALADDMLREKDIASMPSANEPALLLSDAECKRRSPARAPGSRRCPGGRVSLLMILGERHLLRILGEYVGYYHTARTHLSLAKDAPDHRPVVANDNGNVVGLPMVGGLHYKYIRRAA